MEDATATERSHAAERAAAPAGPPVAPSPRSGLVRRLWTALFRHREASILLVAVALVIYFSVSHPAFATFDNARIIAQFIAQSAPIAVGLTMLLICGEIDLSVGRVYAFTPFVMYFAHDAGAPLALAIVVGLAAAAAVGFANGVVTTKFGVPSFITTLGMLFLLAGITLTISNAAPVLAPRGALPDVLGRRPFMGFLWAILIVAIMHVVLNHTRWGVYTYGAGGNPHGAREAGVRVDRIKIGNFMLTATFGGFVGILEGMRLGSIYPLAGGESVMFLAVSAAVIGGTALAGGTGTILGTLLGVVVLSVLRNGFTLQGISADTFNMILGVAILVAMIMNQRLSRLRKGMVAA